MLKRLLRELKGDNSIALMLIVGLNYLCALVMVVVFGVGLSIHLFDQSILSEDGLNNVSYLPKLLFHSVPLLRDLLLYESYPEFAPATVGLILIFAGLGLSLRQRQSFSYWINLLVYSSGAIYFFSTPALNRPDYDVGFVICITAVSLLIADGVVPRFIPRLSAHSWLVLIPVGIVAILLAISSTTHVEFVDSEAEGFTPDSSQIIYGADGIFYNVNLNSGNEQPLFLMTDHQNRFPFVSQPLSPDGKWLAYVSTPQNIVLRITDINTLTERVVAHLGNYGSLNMSWSPDGSRLVFKQSENNSLTNLGIVNPDGTNLHTLVQYKGTFNPQGYNERVLTWSPDGQAILYSDMDGLKLISPDGKDDRMLEVRPQNAIYGEATWSPDGKHIVYQRYKYDDKLAPLYIIDTNGTGQRSIGAGISPHWSPDGQTLYYMIQNANIDNKQFHLDLVATNVDGSNSHVVLRNLSWFTFAISPNGKMIAYHRSKVLCISAIDGTGERCFAKHRRLLD